MPSFHILFLLSLCSLFLCACGGGGSGSGGGDTPPNNDNPPTTVTTFTGMVRAPGDVIAGLEDINSAQLLVAMLIPNAAADITGLVGVEGIDVELVRLDQNGTLLEVISRATTDSSGIYRIETNESAGSLLMVRATVGNAQLFNLALSPTTNIDPVSTFIIQSVLDEVAIDGDLNRFTFEEVSLLNQYATGEDIDLSSVGTTQEAIDNLQTSLGIELSEFANSMAGDGDSIPTQFEFTPGDNVMPEEAFASVPIVISGIDSPAAIVIENGEYSLDGGAFTAATGTVENGQLLQVRLVAPKEFNASVSSRVTINGVSNIFTVSTMPEPELDTTPDDFIFTDQTNLAVNTQVISNATTVAGISAATPVRINGGEYSIDGGSFTRLDGTVLNGQQVSVKVTTSSNFSTTTGAELFIGNKSDTFNVTTQNAPPVPTDTTPDQFTFIDQVDVARYTQVQSNSIIVTGIDSASPITISNGQYSINGGLYTSAPGVVSNAQSVRVRLTSAAGFMTPVSAVLTIGGVRGAFEVTTLAADTTPAAFSFIDQTEVPLDTVVNSNTIIVSGINTATNVSISGGEYSIDGGGFTNSDGTVENGQQIVVRQTSSNAFLTPIEANLTVGGVSDFFKVVTEGNDAPIANAGTDQNVSETDTVVLDSLASNDPEGQPLSYSWVQVSGSSVNLSDNTASQPNFVVPNLLSDEIIVFELTVNDGLLDSLPDYIEVNVFADNDPPTADAGDDIRLLPGDTGSLDCSKSFDPENKSVSYLWEQISGPAITLSDASICTPTFTASVVPGMVEFGLKVNDGVNDSNTDTVLIQIDKYSGEHVNFQGSLAIENSLTISEPIRDIIVSENLLIMLHDTSDGSALVIYNIDEPGNPVEISRLESTDTFFSVIRKNDCLYIGGGKKFYIVDISDHFSPSIVSSMDAGVVFGVELYGNYAYLAERHEVIVVDVSDVENPAEVNRVSVFEFLDFEVENDILAIFDRYGIEIYDLSDPVNPQYGSSYRIGSAWKGGIKLEGTMLYTTGSDIVLSGLYIFDISDPGNMVLVTEFGSGEFGSLGESILEYKNRDIYIVDRDRGLLIVNVENPAEPYLRGNYSLPGARDGKGTAIAIGDDYLYTGSAANGVQIVDVSQPVKLPYLSSVALPVTAEALAVDASKNYAYIGDGLQVVDISDPFNAELVGAYEPHGFALGRLQKVEVIEDRAYTANLSLPELAAFDIENPLAPSFVYGESQSFLSPYDLEIVSDYVAIVGRGLSIFELATGDLVGTTLEGSAVSTGLDVENGIAAVSNQHAGMTFYDISNPVSPQLLGEYSGLTNGRDVALHDNIAYGVYGKFGIHIIDVAIPSNPVLLSEININDFADTIEVIGELGYLTNETFGLSVMDVSNPYDPFVIGSYTTLGKIKDVDIIGGMAYIAEFDLGLGIINIEDRLVANNNYARAFSGQVLNYEVSWSGENYIYTRCIVSDGTCHVESADYEAKRATISWNLPAIVGDYEIVTAIGDNAQHISVRDQLIVE